VLYICVYDVHALPCFLSRVCALATGQQASLGQSLANSRELSGFEELSTTAQPRQQVGWSLGSCMQEGICLFLSPLHQQQQVCSPRDEQRLVSWT
jgi:hypothetical protein